MNIIKAKLSETMNAVAPLAVVTALAWNALSAEEAAISQPQIDSSAAIENPANAASGPVVSEDAGLRIVLAGDEGTIPTSLSSPVVRYERVATDPSFEPVESVSVETFLDGIEGVNFRPVNAENGHYGVYSGDQPVAVSMNECVDGTSRAAFFDVKLGTWPLNGQGIEQGDVVAILSYVPVSSRDLENAYMADKAPAAALGHNFRNAGESLKERLALEHHDVTAIAHFSTLLPLSGDRHSVSPFACPVQERVEAASVGALQPTR